MRQYVLPSLLVCFLLGAVHVLRSDETAAAHRASDIALIDMSKVFTSYHRFDALRQELQKEIEAGEVQAKQMLAEVASLKKEYQQAKKDKDSERAAELNAKISRATDEQAKFVKDTQKQFIKKESELYRTIYAEISSLVMAYCKERRIKLVMRFSSEEVVEPNAEPAKVLKSLNRHIVYEEGLDITDEILRRANMAAK
jgi:outer membrane protein